MRTLLLDTVAWDLVLDVNGNIAVADEPYALAQLIGKAMTVPGVTAAAVYFISITERAVRGQVQVTDLNGITTAANF
jgi:hypothetical protein